MIITEKDLNTLKTKKGGFSLKLIAYVKEFTQSNRFKKSIINKEIPSDVWDTMVKLSGQTKKLAVSKGKIINNMAFQKDDWSWKPDKKDIPEVKTVSKSEKSRGKKKAKREKVSRLKHTEFYFSDEWRSLRVRVLQKYSCTCMMCGRSPKLHGVVIHVDHIKPRSKFPELSLDFDNLQLLCDDCNLGKKNKYQTDYRPEQEVTIQ